ncbi:phosphate acyltransferase PlsX [Mycoplasma procyoni]|uniref:phosphate acyltransferase PlsX n=1 Tax=Mycoplasma procyoni TaxID=568784 RepID=UPI00197CA726|nr:phosphate acyltransferase PlsX [Mycoplasma procyoni]MBN3534356.1 phosphate acyltransferase PlsX [Mycoplasma procyoni]
MKKIAFDLMGNDNGVKPGVESALLFIQKNPDYKIFLVGNEQEIKQYLTQDSEQIEIINVEKVVEKNETNIRALARETTSMSVTMDLLLENKVDAILSSGDSASYLSLSTLKLKRLENVSRPAFMPMIPTAKDDKFFLLLDSGANLEVKPEYFEQWGIIASIFYKHLFKYDNPSVGLINIGTEDYKGFDYHKEANVLLKQNSKINYKGFIEPRDILKGDIEIALADGYAGNITLKSLEGTVLTFSRFLKEKITSSFFRKIAALMLKKAFKEVKEKFDYRNVGAAWVIGVNGVVLKAHGSSDTKAYTGALNQIKIAVESNVLAEVKEALK